MIRTFWLAAVAAALCACSAEPEPEPQGMAQLRVLLEPTSASTVALKVDGELLIADLGTEQSARWLDVQAGVRAVEITTDGGTTTIFEETLRLSPDERYTIMPSNGLVLTDQGRSSVNAEDEPAMTASIRLVHAVDDIGAVDLFVTPPAAGLDDVPTIVDVAAGEASPFTDVSAGTARLRLTAAGVTEDVVFDSGVIELTAGDRLTFIAMSAAEGSRYPVELLALTDDGSFTIAGYEPCGPDAVDAGDTRETALDLADGFALGAICAAGDVDMYRISVAEPVVITATARAGVGSPFAAGVSLLDEQLIDSSSSGELGVLVLEPGSYYVEVYDVTGSGGEDFDYQLTVATAPSEAAFEAVVGTFNAASNRSTIPAFSGNLLAVSARLPDGSPVPYKVMMRITHPVSGEFPFLYDPAPSQSGMLSIVLTDGDSGLPLPTLRELSLEARRRSVQSAPAPSIARFAPKGVALPQAAASGTFVFEFPNTTIERAIDAGGAIEVPTITRVLPSANNQRLRVIFTPPAGASVFEAHAYGIYSAVTGVSRGTASPLRVSLSGALTEEEPYAVRLRAGDVGLAELPLPSSPLHLSEYLWFSNTTDIAAP